MWNIQSMMGQIQTSALCNIWTKQCYDRNILYYNKQRQKIAACLLFLPHLINATLKDVRLDLFTNNPPISPIVFSFLLWDFFSLDEGGGNWNLFKSILPLFWLNICGVWYIFCFFTGYYLSRFETFSATIKLQYHNLSCHAQVSPGSVQ